MKFSVCLPAVFEKMPPAQALALSREAGMESYELWSWWDCDMDEILRAQRETGLRPAAILTPLISLTDPECRGEYIQGLKRTIDACRQLGCKSIISQVGSEIPGVTRRAQHESIVEGLRMCLPVLEGTGITLLIEPLNTRIEHKGYYLWSAGEGFEIVDEVGSPCVRMLYDIYHQYVMDDVDMSLIRENIVKIGHFHVAGYPGRHEPLGSDIDYMAIFREILDMGYDGAFGLEYMSAGDPVSGLKAILAATADM
jgi:hydroxypyruvate isomerase